MQCKVRPYKLVEEVPGHLSKVSSQILEVIWDEDMFFPIQYQSRIVSEIQILGHVNPRISPTQEIIIPIEKKLNAAIVFWKKHFGLTNDKTDFGKSGKVGILLKDPNYEIY